MQRSMPPSEVPVAEPPAERSSHPRLASVVYDQLFRLIARGDFPRDCKLPPEGDLALRFGVSRPVIRDALARLRDGGVVRSQRGSGTVVVKGAVAPALAFPTIQTVADLLRSYEFRITVETATVRAAAERGTAADIAGIRQALQDAENALDGGLFHLMPDLNFTFHRAVAMATHNNFYVATLELIPNLVGVDHLETAAFGDQGIAERMRRIHSEHGSICDAISDRDPAAAVARMQVHIQSARDFVLERQELKPLMR